MRSFEIYGKQASMHTHVRNAVMLVWGSLRLTPIIKHTLLQATDPGETITMVTVSGRSFIQQIKTEDNAVQQTNTAAPGQLVLGTEVD